MKVRRPEKHGLIGSVPSGEQEQSEEADGPNVAHNDALVIHCTPHRYLSHSSISVVIRGPAQRTCNDAHLQARLYARID